MRRTTGVLWLAALGAGLVTLWLTSIPVTDGTTTGFAAVRLAGLVAGTYLAVISLLHMAAGWLRRDRLRALAHGLTVPAVRGALEFALGTSALLAAASGPVLADDRAGGSADPPVLRHIDDDTATADTPRAAAVPLEAPARWTVRPGDHFWSIAEHVMTEALDRPPTEAEVARYWLELIEANRSRLVHPSLPDLVYPGQKFLLPPAP